MEKVHKLSRISPLLQHFVVENFEQKTMFLKKVSVTFIDVNFCLQKCQCQIKIGNKFKLNLAEIVCKI